MSPEPQVQALLSHGSEPGGMPDAQFQEMLRNLRGSTRRPSTVIYSSAYIAQEAALAAQTRVRPTSLQPPPRYEDLGLSHPREPPTELTAAAVTARYAALGLSQPRVPTAELATAATSAAC